MKVISNLNAISEHVRTKEVCIYCDKNMKKSHSRALKEIKPNKKPFNVSTCTKYVWLKHIVILFEEWEDSKLLHMEISISSYMFH